MIRAVVLYEDAQQGRNFGPHQLLCGLIFDTTEQPFAAITRQVAFSALKGRDKLIGAIKDPQRWKRLAPGHAPVFALLDADKIRDHFGGKRAGARDIAEQLRRTCADPKRLRVILLERNLETVLEAIRACDDGRTIPAALFNQSLAKNVNARDVVLGKVGTDDGRKTMRDCVRARVPSLDRTAQLISATIIDT